MRTIIHVGFITVTFQGGEIPEGIEDKIKEYLDKKTVAMAMVQHYGKYGGNNHFHIYYVLRNKTGTDTITRAIGNMYPKELERNRYTILNKFEKDPIYRIGYYLWHESDARTIYVKNINPEYYKEEWKKRQTLATSLLKNKNNMRYTQNQLPSVYLAYCDEKGLSYKEYRDVFSKMYRDGYIQNTQLKNLKYVRLGVELLKGELLPEFLLEFPEENNLRY